MVRQLTTFIKAGGAVAADPKTGATVATATTSAGAGAWFGWIPSDIGALASLIGIILSIVLIFTHVAKFVVEYKHMKWSREMQRKEVEARIAAGLSLSRESDTS